MELFCHCAGHIQNLVIANSCPQRPFANNIDKMKSIDKFLLESPKRAHLLSCITNTYIQDGIKRESLIVRRTRWAERHVTCSRFYTSCSFIVKVLEVVVFKMHTDKYDRNMTEAIWNGKIKNDALIFLYHFIILSLNPKTVLWTYSIFNHPNSYARSSLVGR